MIETIIQKSYSLIRGRLPRKVGTFYNVPIKEPRLLDKYDTQHRKKSETLNELRTHVRPGDRVLIFGGARGLAPIVAARRVLPEGHVTVYEAAEEQCEVTKENVEYNLLDDYVTVKQAIVGNPVDVWGNTEDAVHISSSDLPQSDTWVLDIEGGERRFLETASSEGTSWPDRILVETHSMHGSPPSAVDDALPDTGDVVQRHAITPSHPDNERDDELLVWERAENDCAG